MASHLKRIVAPKTWPILRKTTKFIARPKPNGQKMELTMPIVVIMRDMLRMVQTSTQARKILRQQSVTVNGKRIYDTTAAVGFMDVVDINGHRYRMLINENHNLILAPTKEDFTIQKIIGKTSVKGRTQLNCASGFNLFVDKDSYKVGDSVSVDFSGKAVGHYALEKGARVLLTGGTHIGKMGTVDNINGKVINIKAGDETLQTATIHAYALPK